MLKGGPGATTSYGKSAEDSWTGFGGSGENSNPGIAGLVGAPGMINDLLTWGRDNTNIRERWLGSQPEVSGNVFYELGVNGFSITGVSINNYSYEKVAVRSVFAEIKSTVGETRVSSERIYPPLYPTIQTPAYGIAQPGTSSEVITMGANLIPYSYYADVSLNVISISGRYGSLGIRLSIDHR
jgi:hypothetical protein